MPASAHASTHRHAYAGGRDACGDTSPRPFVADNREDLVYRAFLPSGLSPSKFDFHPVIADLDARIEHSLLLLGTLGKDGIGIVDMGVNATHMSEILEYLQRAMRLTDRHVTHLCRGRRAGLQAL